MHDDINSFPSSGVRNSKIISSIFSYTLSLPFFFKAAPNVTHITQVSIGIAFVFLLYNYVKILHISLNITVILCVLSISRLRIVSYNILADRYVDGEQFSYTPRRAIGIHYRKQLIMKELQGMYQILLHS